MHHPSSTYRIQFHAAFTFKDLLSLVDYLHDMGVSAVYASPITAARTGSMHGYDVTDPGKINPEIGTLDEFKNLSLRLRGKGISWIQDIVPNHMAFSTENARLMDVLERGHESMYYHYFDMDWSNPEFPGKVCIPVLGKEYEVALQQKELQFVFEEGQGFGVQYAEHVFPLAIDAQRELVQMLRQDKAYAGFGFVMDDYLKGASRKEWSSWQAHKEKSLKELRSFTPLIKEGLIRLNAGTEQLEKILELQPYRLVHWQYTERHMTYRRFFTINDLIALRIEDKVVFDDYHALFFTLYEEGFIQGFRIDHVDGLKQPREYVDRLRKKLGKECYLVVEKILEYEEHLPVDWKLQGSSGYDFLPMLNKVFTHQEGAEKLKQFYHSFTRSNVTYDNLVFTNKYNYLTRYMQGELQYLMREMKQWGLLSSISLKEEQIRKGLAYFMAAFPVYRIYPQAFPLPEEELLAVERAYSIALEHDRLLKQELEFIKSLFTPWSGEQAEAQLAFIVRLMQFTGPLAAKGVEDTTFYVYNPLISHNEVGDAPSEFSCTPKEFHDRMKDRFLRCPLTLNGSSTHDTKRGEDARARLNVLSHVPHEWEASVMEWTKLNAPFIRFDGVRRMPSLNDEYFIYQSLVGALPEDLKVTDEFIERTCRFLTKALREAKVETTYTSPDERYEDSCLEFARRILSEEHGFLDRFVPFMERLAPYAASYSLSQVILKATAPGIPDVYQGSELWDFSYVDPDNRRPVDYDRRQRLLHALYEQKQRFDWLLLNRSTGAEKMYVLQRLLWLRKEQPDLFLYGTYTELQVENSKGQCLAFLRHHDGSQLIVVLPLTFKWETSGRLMNLCDDAYLSLPDGGARQWVNVLTEEGIDADQSFPLSDAFRSFPVAVYLSKGS